MKRYIGAGALVACLVSLTATVAQAQAPVEPGANWLLTQQFPSGAYPWTVGEATAEGRTQGTTARGMLAAFDLLNEPGYRDSAVRTGDFLVDSYPRTFTDGDPDIFPLDPLFLEELTHVTGDSRYSDFVQANLWDKLTAGTYGESNNQDAAAWAAAIPNFAPEFPFNSLEPLFRASPAIAAHYKGHTAIRDALMTSVLLRLNATTGTSAAARRGDLTALGAVILASAHTGTNLDPTAGRWASASNTQGLVDLLVGFQRVGGDWPYDSSTAASTAVGDVSVTNWAVYALKAWNATTYASNISSGLSFIQAQQQPDGQILTNPGFSTTTVTGVEVHAEALVAFASGDGVLLNDVPTVSLLGTATVNPGATVQVKVEHGPGNPRDWLALHTSAASDLDFLDWKYLDGSRIVPNAGERTATVSFRMPAQPGTYNIRLFEDNGPTRLATSATITVQATPVTLTVIGPTTVNVGSTVQVSVAGGPGNTTDWVGMFATSAADTAFLDWQYLSGTRTPPGAGLTAATLSFTMPSTPGTYNFRFFPIDSYVRLATSVTVTVVNPASTITVIGPSTVSPGANVQVSVQDGPGNPRDWVGLYAVGAPNSALRDWKYLNGTRTPPASGFVTATVDFTMPTSLGTYEFRFFSNNSYQLLATSGSVVVQ